MGTHTHLRTHLASQGALLCLAAATVGLGEPSQSQLQLIVPTVLESFKDQVCVVICREGFLQGPTKEEALEKRGAPEPSTQPIWLPTAYTALEEHGQL